MKTIERDRWDMTWKSIGGDHEKYRRRHGRAWEENTRDHERDMEGGICHGRA